MYRHYFSLNTKPFELLPDPAFLFPGSVHKKALLYLEYGIQEQSGFILFTGEVGAGKTTLIRALIAKVPERVTIAKIFNTQVESEQLLKMINDDFGISSTGTDKADLLRDLNRFLIEQYAEARRSILIIDEAQNLGPAQLEEIRLLSNLETAHAKLLQIILVGQPELRDRLGSPELIQLRQRILVHCHLSPLNAVETGNYIFHRLEQAGNRHALLWHEGAMERVHAASRGIPRLINILCDYILLDAFSADNREVSAESVGALLAQLDFEAQFWPDPRDASEPLSCGAMPDGQAQLGAMMENVRMTAEILRESMKIANQTVHAAGEFLLAAMQLRGEHPATPATANSRNGHPGRNRDTPQTVTPRAHLG